MSTARVTISQPGQRTRRVSLDGAVTSVGRRPDNVVCLESDTNVSKYHAVIENSGGEFWVTDLGSSNGTTVNGEPLFSRRKLLDGDLVCLGGTSTLEFHLPEGRPAQPQPPAPEKTAAAIPPVRLPSQPSMHLPSQPSLNVPTPQTLANRLPSPQAELQRAVNYPKYALYGLIGVGSTGALLALLWGVGVIGGGAGAKNPSAARTGSRAEVKAGGSAGAGAAAGGSAAAETRPAASQAQAADAPTPSAPTAEEGASTSPAASAQGSDAGSEATGNLARTLAVQISQKSFYKFDPSFVALINNYVNEYRGAAGYYERAGKYRAAIDREFVNVQGIQPPLIAYVTAMSQTKFVEGGGGVWKLPPSVVSAYAPEGEGVDARDPAASTRVAAAYIRSLLDLFEKDNFMYAVACYGMTLDQAGQVRLALESKDPGGRERYDFWKMKNAGVVRGEQVERVARFFAAGIVCENPRQFGLKDEPLSSLY